MCCVCVLITGSEHVEHVMSDCVYRDNCEVCLRLIAWQRVTVSS